MYLRILNYIRRLYKNFDLSRIENSELIFLKKQTILNIMFQDRRDARKYVTQMLKAGFIKHTVNKTTFSEQCYYTFCDDKFLAGSKFLLQSTTISTSTLTEQIDYCNFICFHIS